MVRYVTAFKKLLEPKHRGVIAQKIGSTRGHLFKKQASFDLIDSRLAKKRR